MTNVASVESRRPRYWRLNSSAASFFEGASIGYVTFLDLSFGSKVTSYCFCCFISMLLTWAGRWVTHGHASRATSQHLDARSALHHQRDTQAPVARPAGSFPADT